MFLSSINIAENSVLHLSAIQELLSWLLQSFCSASSSVGSIVQQRWLEMNGNHWRKQNCCGCTLGKRRCQTGNKHWGQESETEEQGSFCLYQHVAGSLHACVILTSFLVHCGSLWHPDTHKYERISSGRLRPLATPYSINIFYTQGSLSQIPFLSFMYLNYLKLSAPSSLQLSLRGRERMDLTHLSVELGVIDNHLKAKFCKFCLQL